jgi:hypothetical protein
MKKKVKNNPVNKREMYPPGLNITNPPADFVSILKVLIKRTLAFSFPNSDND